MGIINLKKFRQTRMVNKTFAIAAALALIAGSVKASAAMDNLIDTVNTNLSVDGLIMPIYNQIYNFIIVLAAGPVYSLLDFLYYNFSFPLALDELGITGLPFNLILTFVGIETLPNLSTSSMVLFK